MHVGSLPVEVAAADATAAAAATATTTATASVVVAGSSTAVVALGDVWSETVLTLVLFHGY